MFTGSSPILLALLLTSSHPQKAQAQDRLASMPGYERYKTQTRKMPDAMGGVYAGTVLGAWTEDSKAYVYSKGGKLYRYDVGTKQVTEAHEMPRSTARPDFGGGGFLERGRQATVSVSPDKKHRAQYKDGNVWIGAGDGANLTAITTDGGKQGRIFYGTASWVYGEELEQHSAMWWSPDSKKLAYYRFDESKVPDYYVALNNLQVQDTLDAEPYPKAGAPNPIVDLYVYDVEARQNVRMDVRDGKPFTDEAMGHYVYNIRWSPDGANLLFNRTNRLQNIMEFTACDPKTGHCRTIVRESRPASWTANLPAYTFLKDGKRFMWASERTGWRNLYLYDLSGKLLAPLTKHAFDIDQTVRVDEAANRVYYMARDGDNPFKLQLHRVNLDGTGDTRLTDPKLNHRVDIAPDGKTFADIAQAHDVPASTRLVDAKGSIVTTLAQGDMTALQTAGFAPPELFTCKTGDGKSDMYGLLYKPSKFDASRKYPLLVDVYAGPETPQAEMVRENFFRPQGLAEMGFLVASFDGRGTTRRGKAYMDAVYGRLGQAEIDDQAAGVKFLRQRPYVDGARVGVYGTSYGGYASIMCLLRYPDVFQAASASSAVTDWHNYDSIYTERYMGLPQQNKAGYEAGSAMTYAKDLKGKLLLYYGTADNNVHPSNTLQLIAALERAGKSYELQVGPDQGHSGVNYNRMIEFFMDNLVLKPVENRGQQANINQPQEEKSVRLLEPPEQGFFAKELDYEGIRIKAPAVVADNALFVARDRIARLLKNLPNARYNLSIAGAELHIIGKDQVTSDLPEHRHLKGKPFDGKLTVDERTRGLGGLLTSCGEENLLELPDDRYKGRDICTHEFAHNLQDHGLSDDARQKIRDRYQRSLNKGLWKGAYAATNVSEYFAELTMWYFGTHGDLHMTGQKPANGPQGLKAYDSEAYALLDDLYSGRIPIAIIKETSS